MPTYLCPLGGVCRSTCVFTRGGFGCGLVLRRSVLLLQWHANIGMLTETYLSSLERAIEREGERAGERHERERLLRRDGLEWERFVKRRRQEGADGRSMGDGDKEARDDDMRVVLSRGDMDELTSKLQDVKKDGEATATVQAPVAAAPVRYRAVHYAIPTDEYQELTEGSAGQ